MSKAQIDRLSSRLLDKANKIEEDDDASSEEQDVMVALLDCVEALDRISARLEKH